MSKLGSNDILPLIHTYLVEIGMQKLAKKLEKEAGFNLENNVIQSFIYYRKKTLSFIETRNCWQKT